MHSYTILGVHEFLLDDFMEYLLKISNPWGNTEWLGDWSDHSNIWSDEIKKKINFEKKDGAFYMNFKDFKHYFSKVQICKVCDGFVYNHIKLMQSRNGYTLVKIRLDIPSKLFISLSQQDKKNFNNDNYKYSIARFIISRIEGTNLEYISGKMAQEREFFEEKYLEEGSYLLYIEIDWIDIEYPFVLSKINHKVHRHI